MVSMPTGPARAVLPVTKGERRGEKPETLQPSGWPMPKGYANGMAADGRLVVTGGVIGWDHHGDLPADFVAQVRQTLSNISAILAEGGARPRSPVYGPPGTAERIARAILLPDFRRWLPGSPVRRLRAR